MGFALARTELFEDITCGNCGIVFYVPDSWYQKRRNGEGGNFSFVCPNGHHRHFIGETPEDKAKRERDAAISAKAFAERRLVDEQERHRKELKRIQKRQKAGVCPCCHRTISQMARHMKTKHPDWPEPQEAKG